MFSTRLKQLREEHRISQAHLARAIGVGQSTVGMWESGKNYPEFKTLEKLSEYFGVSTDFFLGRDDEDIKKEVAALSDDDLNSEIINLLTTLFPGREEFALKTLQTLAEIPESQHELALGMLQVLKDHEA